MRTLLEESRGGLQQLPFYARITAVLAQVFPDVSAQLLHSLEDELSKLLVSTAEQLYKSPGEDQVLEFTL